jgi:hypothetical protein
MQPQFPAPCLPFRRMHAQTSNLQLPNGIVMNLNNNMYIALNYLGRSRVNAEQQKKTVMVAKDFVCICIRTG